MPNSALNIKIDMESEDHHSNISSSEVSPVDIGSPVDSDPSECNANARHSSSDHYGAWPTSSKDGYSYPLVHNGAGPVLKDTGKDNNASDSGPSVDGPPETPPKTMCCTHHDGPCKGCVSDPHTDAPTLIPEEHCGEVPGFCCEGEVVQASSEGGQLSDPSHKEENSDGVSTGRASSNDGDNLTPALIKVVTRDDSHLSIQNTSIAKDDNFTKTNHKVNDQTEVLTEATAPSCGDAQHIPGAWEDDEDTDDAVGAKESVDRIEGRNDTDGVPKKKKLGWIEAFRRLPLH